MPPKARRVQPQSRARQRTSPTDERRLLIGALLKAREYILTDNTNPLGLTDALGRILEKVLGHWPSDDDLDSFEVDLVVED